MSAVRKALLPLWSAYFLATDGLLYERVGIRRVGRVMLGGYYSLAAINRMRGREHRRLRGRRTAWEWLIFTVVAELSHLLFFVIMLAISARDAAAGRWERVAIVAVVNVFVNVVPIMVQRYNRARIVRALKLDAISVLDARRWESGLGLAKRSGP